MGCKPAFYFEQGDLNLYFGSRWLRLLFTREFSLPDAMRLWDGLFACDPTLELAQWVCVAMLIRIRNQCKINSVEPQEV